MKPAKIETKRSSRNSPAGWRRKIANPLAWGMILLMLLAVGGWPLVLWGIFLRVTLGLHATWFVNSATHMWGSRRFDTRDDSRNSWWVALVTGGEGWHNNHHAHPVSARHGLAWYEFDLNYYGIWMMGRLGLAKKINALTIAQATIDSPSLSATRSNL